MDYFFSSGNSKKSSIGVGEQNQKSSFLIEGINALKKEIGILREALIVICEKLKELEALEVHKEKKSFSEENVFNVKSREFNQNNASNKLSFFEKNNPAHTSTNPAYQRKNPADNWLFKPLNAKNLKISTGNRGVPADRQTNQQTDICLKTASQSPFFSSNSQKEDDIKKAAEMLRSFEGVKQEIYKKFKGLTEMEWKVFLLAYQFDEEKGYSDYRLLAEKLKLTESSIRDYISKIMKKGLPIKKTRLNNKNVRVTIDHSFKQLASLSTLVSFRDS